MKISHSFAIKILTRRQKDFERELLRIKPFGDIPSIKEMEDKIEQLKQTIKFLQ